MCVCMRVRMQGHVHVHVYVSVCECAFICVCVHAFVCVRAYRENGGPPIYNRLKIATCACLPSDHRAQLSKSLESL